MRIGIYGGTFDPVHIGHLIIAAQAREQAQLDEVWFIPSARPPHKLDQTITSFDRRHEMLQLALAGQARFKVQTFERDRPGPSFTVDTLEDLNRQHPDNDYFLIFGADCLADFPNWRAPERILELATLLVAARPGWDVWDAQRLASAIGIGDSSKVRLQTIDVPLVDISSRNLRERVQAERGIQYMVPRAIEVYIREKKLYTTSNPSSRGVQ